MDSSVFKANFSLKIRDEGQGQGGLWWRKECELGACSC